MRQAFSCTINHRATEKSKKIGALFVTNQLFKMYFAVRNSISTEAHICNQLNKLRLCGYLIKSMESPVSLPLSAFPLSQTVSWFSLN